MLADVLIIHKAWFTFLPEFFCLFFSHWQPRVLKNFFNSFPPKPYRRNSFQKSWDEIDTVVTYVRNFLQVLSDFKGISSTWNGHIIPCQELIEDHSCWIKVSLEPNFDIFLKIFGRLIAHSALDFWVSIYGRNLLTQVKIAEPKILFFVDKNIFRFDIEMSNPFWVEILESNENTLCRKT